MIEAKEIDGELWIKAADYHKAVKVAVENEREQCKKLCQWKTGNQFVDEAIAVCYRAIDQRGQA